MIRFTADEITAAFNELSRSVVVSGISTNRASSRKVRIPLSTPQAEHLIRQMPRKKKKAAWKLLRGAESITFKVKVK